MSVRRIILDCDPGHDDAVAIMMAGKSPAVDLMAITVVAGNQTMEKTLENALHVCQQIGLEVPVYGGCSRPLLREPIYAGFVHGESGLDGTEFDPLTKEAEQEHAVRYLADTIMHTPEPVTLVATGPLTNVAMTLRLEPGVSSHIDEILLMGGAMGSGNITPAAEFNMYCDPEAADIVFRSGIPVRMVGLDVTQRALCTPSVYERIESHGTVECRLFGDMMRYYCRMEKKVFGVEGGALHDPVTIAWLIDPNVLVFEEMDVEIDRNPGSSYGRTNCDRYHWKHGPGNALVAVDINEELFWKIVEDSLK